MSAEPQQKILVVDDTKENLDLVFGLLGKQYRLLLAINGPLALKIAQSRQPDLILLDIMMPKMDGFEVCEVLKSDPRTRDIPVIFLTALSRMQDEVRGFSLGAADFITKPISPPVLSSRVRTHLALANQRRALEVEVAARTADLEQAMKRLEHSNLEILSTRLEIIRRLGRAAEFRDNETGLHVIRMSSYAALLAQACGMEQSRVDLLLNASPMHDVGKIGIPDSILLKPGPLSDQEWQVMREHPRMGAEIIGEHEDEMMSMARTLALTHHEKWDGSGYPHGLAGEEIPLVGRIVAIADVFDALTTDRPYKAAWGVEEAVALLREERGGHFDPRLVDRFLDHLPEVLEIRERYAETGVSSEMGAVIKGIGGEFAAPKPSPVDLE